MDYSALYVLLPGDSVGDEVLIQRGNYSEMGVLAGVARQWISQRGFRWDVKGSNFEHLARIEANEGVLTLPTLKKEVQ